VWLYAGLALVALVVIGFGVWLLLRRRSLSAGEIVLVAATSALLIPLLLPQMHERYFYLAEVLLVVACMVDRRFAVAALGIQVASISTLPRLPPRSAPYAVDGGGSLRPGRRGGGDLAARTGPQNLGARRGRQLILSRYGIDRTPSG